MRGVGWFGVFFCVLIAACSNGNGGTGNTSGSSCGSSGGGGGVFGGGSCTSSGPNGGGQCGTSTGNQACDQCVSAKCCEAGKACGSGSECAGLIGCLEQCQNDSS